VKHTLYLFLLMCVMSIALTGLDAQAARSKPRPKTALVVGPSVPVLSCPDEFPQLTEPAESFPESGFSGPSSSYDDGYQYDSSVGGFSCLVSDAIDAHSVEQSRAYWMNTTRLIPSFPQIDNAFFLPIGWQWIELDK